MNCLNHRPSKALIHHQDVCFITIWVIIGSGHGYNRYIYHWGILQIVWGHCILYPWRIRPGSFFQCMSCLQCYLIQPCHRNLHYYWALWFGYNLCLSLLMSSIFTVNTSNWWRQNWLLAPICTWTGVTCPLGQYSGALVSLPLHPVVGSVMAEATSSPVRLISAPLMFILVPLASNTWVCWSCDNGCHFFWL